MNRLMRTLTHLTLPDWWLRRTLSRAALDRIERAVTDSEARHGAEIRVVLETGLGLLPLLKGQTARQRAEALFASLRVWDTELNNGVLIYLLLADREFEIVADRGVARAIGQDQWEGLCRAMETHFRAGHHEAALLYGIGELGKRLEALYPHRADDADELPDRPLIL
jgi:uncharacterized membrane protein